MAQDGTNGGFFMDSRPVRTGRTKVDQPGFEEIVKGLAHEADRYGVTMAKEPTRSEILRVANTISTRMKNAHGMLAVSQFWQRWRKVHDLLFETE